jgi:hypothetical protein
VGDIYMMKMKAVCVKTVTRKNGKDKGTVIFAKDKIYEFSTEGLLIDFYRLGKYRTQNELGTESYMDEEYFNEHFKILEVVN